MGKKINPCGGAKPRLDNPLRNGGKVKRLKEHHDRQMRGFGIKPSKNPLAR